MISPSSQENAPASTQASSSQKRFPRHIAIIMDGNGRWAQRQSLPRIEGHRRGAESVRRVAERCIELGIPQLTLYCLSSENWKRPADELEFLMALLSQYLRQEMANLRKQGVRLETIGRIDQLPQAVQQNIAEAKAALSGESKLRLCLAINYGGRSELVDAVKDICREVQAGRMNLEQIDEAIVEQFLYTAGMPDPDLLIRTAGEMRISNFLLWQISYSEFWVTPKTWPEFEAADLDAALADYLQRDRRFGGLSQAEAPPC